MRKRFRFSALAFAALVVITTVAPGAQPPDSAKREGQEFGAAGPFLFEAGVVHPTYMDAFDSRPFVKSPDGKLGLSVTGPAQSYQAW